MKQVGGTLPAAIAPKRVNFAELGAALDALNTEAVRVGFSFERDSETREITGIRYDAELADDAELDLAPYEQAIREHAPELDDDEAFAAKQLEEAEREETVSSLRGTIQALNGEIEALKLRVNQNETRLESVEELETRVDAANAR